MAGETPAQVWTRPRTDPPRRAPGLDRYVAQAIAVADVEGVEAVSMRRVAGDLGSGTASLYRYVRSREELLALMVDRARGEPPPPDPQGEWRADLTGYAGWLRDSLLIHPWLAVELVGRPSLGPNGLRAGESAMRAAIGLTSDIALAARAVSVVTAYVLGAVGRELAELAEQRRTGLTKEQWQASMGSYVKRIIEAGEHPMLARRVLEVEEEDPAAAFAFGLGCVLDGLAAARPQ